MQVDGLASIGGSSNDSFAAASKAAAQADATVVVLGLAFDSYCGKDRSKGDTCECEGNDRKVIELPAGQAAMVAAMKEASKGPLIGVLVHGGTIAFSEATLGALDAVLDAWYASLLASPPHQLCDCSTNCPVPATGPSLRDPVS